MTKPKSVRELTNLSGKKVFLRVDWSIPSLSNTYQVKATLPTIEYLQKAGAKVILATHTEGVSIKELKQFVPEGVKILPNLRKTAEEKNNSEKFAKKLASMADVYVNEAFSVSHREHASIVGVPKLLPGYIGLQFEREIDALSKVFGPNHPFLFIIGGAKFDTKIPLLKKFISIADNIFVGGALANNFFKEQGRDIGESLVSEGDFGLKELMNTGKIVLPDDVITAALGRIVDIGPKSLELLKPLIKESKLILWNGPMGQYEGGYKVSTLELAKIIANSGQESIVGGGDTLAAITELGITDKFSFVSTGGGAMLDFLANETLPGIEVLSK